jgi:pseudouridylate synthase / pseudouridine kinase
VIKSSAIMPALVACLDKQDASHPPITFASPNLLELAQMHSIARSYPWDLTDRSGWWATIDNFSLGSAFRTDLEQLARRNVCNHSSTTGTLSFLIETGIAQMAINLLPCFQNIVVKCGERGVVVVLRISGEDIAKSGWVAERSNAESRYVVAHGKEELIVLQHFPPHVAEEEKFINVTGAGDTLVGTILASLVQDIDTFSSPTGLTNTIDAAQRSAVLTLQSPYAVSPLLSQRR